MDNEKLKASLRLHEGQRKRGDRHIVYDDANGKPIVAGSQVIGNPTVGIGRNLAGRGLSETTVDQMLDEDIAGCLAECNLYPWFRNLNDARQNVILEMCFNMGFATLSKFTYTLGLIAKGDYHGASIAMGQSKWAHQVGSRAVTLQEQMDSGVFK